ncbi:MAG: alginate lyase family protein [Thalassotalea sp.]
MFKEKMLGLGIILFASISLISCGSNANKSATNAEQWENLLDKDLSQWDVWIGVPHSSVKDLPAGTYQSENVTSKAGQPMGLNNDPKQVFKTIEEDGELVLAISGEVYGGLTSKKEYENYHLTMQFKWGDKKWAPRLERKRDSGILFHCKGKHGEFWNVWKICHELQIQETDIGDYIPLAGPASKVRIRPIDGVLRYDPTATLRPVSSYRSASIENDAPHGQWNIIDLIAFEDKAIFKVNNEVVMVFEGSIDNATKALTNGELQIQSEGAELYYREMKIKQISSLPEVYNSLFSAQNNDFLANTAKKSIYYNDEQLAYVKNQLKENNPYYLKHYQQLISDADKFMLLPADPVVNKSRTPPSGNKHDYLSYAKYRWPDPASKNGEPWIARDGVINPVSQGGDLDHERLHNFMAGLESLTFAYYFSEQDSYALKGIELINTWFLNPETRVHPNINFGQGVPGLTNGRAAGIIDWSVFSSVISALQVFDNKGILPAATKQGMILWINRYLEWLLNHPLGKKANLIPQNHSNSYNFQVIAYMLYLGRTEQARAKIEDAKHSRIAKQIQPNGAQPLELGRTKSVHYSVRNLWDMVQVAYMGEQVGLDLWQFTTEDGRSLQQAFAYLAPYANHQQQWQFKQITDGGVEQSIAMELKPLFSKASSLLGHPIVGYHNKMAVNLSALDALKYPPIDEFLQSLNK